MTALGKSKDTRAVPILVQMVQKNSGGLQHAAMIALGYIGDKAASDVLLGVLKRTDLGARINAATALGRLGEPRAWDDITRLAEIHYHHTAGVKIPAMDALIRIDPARAFDLMLKYLETADAHNVSWYAHLCRRLGESGDPRAVKPMVGLLMHDLPEVRKSAVDGIKTMGEKAVPALIELLRTPDVKVAKPEDKPAAEQARRSFVAVVLSEIGAPAVEGILAALHDKQPKVRVAAAWALGPIGDPRAVAPLIATLKDENEEVQGAAMWALGQSKDKRAIDPLMGFIKHEKLRAAAVEALGVIADDRVLDAILAALKDKDELVREAAAIALGEIGDTRARPALELALNDPVSEVQSAAKNAIFKLRDKRKAEEAPPKTSAPKK
jgi:HEAT repeat protein